MDSPRRPAPIRAALKATLSSFTFSSTLCLSSPATRHVCDTNQLRATVDQLFRFSVVTARDAWIQADTNRFAGANECILWRAFASRGLGVNAANYVDDSTVPAGC